MLVGGRGGSYKAGQEEKREEQGTRREGVEMVEGAQLVRSGLWMQVGSWPALRTSSAGIGAVACDWWVA